MVARKDCGKDWWLSGSIELVVAAASSGMSDGVDCPTRWLETALAAVWWVPSTWMILKLYIVGSFLSGCTIQGLGCHPGSDHQILSRFWEVCGEATCFVQHLSNCQCYTLHWCVRKICCWSELASTQCDFLTIFTAKGAGGKACTMFLE